MEDNANHQKASDNLIASLYEKITGLTSMLEKSSLSETEAKWLARYRHRQQYKRSAEQARLLKTGHEITRDEEKSEWPDDADYTNDDMPSAPATPSGDQAPAKKKKKSLDKRSTRTDYQKNKPYTATPVYHKLHEYFTLPEGGHFVKRKGEVETWWYREQMKKVWELTIKKAHNWMLDETSGLVGVKTESSDSSPRMAMWYIRYMTMMNFIPTNIVRLALLT